jgi:hypothetical protein
MGLGYILDILIYIFQSSSIRTLDTRRVDNHIMELRKHSWFNELYLDEKYRKLLIMNYKIRSYLDSPFFVKRLIKDSNARKKFIALIQKQEKQSNKA